MVLFYWHWKNSSLNLCQFGSKLYIASTLTHYCHSDWLGENMVSKNESNRQNDEWDIWAERCVSITKTHYLMNMMNELWSIYFIYGSVPSQHDIFIQNTYKRPPITWWRHQMETFSALLAICVGNSPVPVNSPHKGQWSGAFMFSLIWVWINAWVNNREAGDLRRRRGHYDVTLMTCMWKPTLLVLIMQYVPVNRGIVGSGIDLSPQLYQGGDQIFCFCQRDDL